MAASPFKVERYSGTPKTTSNGLEQCWQDSSQAIWHIPCQQTGCKHENICKPDVDLIDMLGARTLVCRKCGQPVDSRLGYFVHSYPDRQMTFAGYHMPQPIFPMHYEDPNAWLILKEAQRESAPYLFYNEVLGWAYDVGAQLITEGELRGAGKTTLVEPADFPHSDYIMSITGCDYGGRGKEKTSDKVDFISNTAIATGGMRSDGVVEIRCLSKIRYDADNIAQNEILKEVAAKTRSEWCAIDYAGAGNVQETLLVSAGWPKERIVPFTYASMSINKPIVFFTPSSAAGVRHSYILDKSRSLQLLVQLIKAGKVILPEWDSAKHLLNDFLSIYAETTEGPSGSPKTLVKRVRKKTDDIAHAINFVCMALYHATDMWPDLASVFQNLNDDKYATEGWSQSDLN